PAGTRIYVHGGIVRDTSSIYNDGLMVFLKNGSLDSRGTIAQPVVIQGDRLEKDFEDVKSQWVGMLFWQQSINNKLSNTIIKNSIIGIRADSMAQLSMYACQIHNTGGTALIGRHANIYAENCLFSDNAAYGIQLTYGGKYTFNYCTVGNYQGQNAAIYMDDVHCEDFFCSADTRRLNHLKATFANCIFAGNDKDEVQLNRYGKGQVNFDYMFKNCVVKVDELILPNNYPDFFDFCTSCINVKSTDKLFLKRNDGDFRLDTMSVALGKALPLANVPRDIIDKVRKTKPDIGCFEF
ncbi:MAG: right-handed parallel beta-helix repeat-containing protein, partial [Saprospiraceae bacterium]